MSSIAKSNRCSALMIEVVALLMSEGCDAVQILASFPDDDGGTRFLYYGDGNVFAREAMANSWAAASAENRVTRMMEEWEEREDDDEMGVRS